MSKKYHFIAIGGAVMHNLALALLAKGYEVSGSDDEIYEPSRSRLKNAGILPIEKGWFPEKIQSDLDGIILGMHARIDNPELIRAKELNIPIYSFPEFIYNQSQDKQRVVISGSHGKTTITSMILHVLKYLGMDFDYLVGAQIEGFDLMVKLSDAPVIIIEGDEYLTSPVDRRPKFFHYHHHILLMSGIAWDHFNVFPTFENYKSQFEELIQMTPQNGTFIYCENDPEVKELAEKTPLPGVKKIPYSNHPNLVKDGKTLLITAFGELPIAVFGNHNLQNLQGALEVCRTMGINDEEFYKAIQHFKGAAKRQEILAQAEDRILFRDFAHAPSKLKATVNAVKNQFPKRRLIAVQELHTYSSLNKDFVHNYAHTFDEADMAIIYLNPKAVSLKKLELMDESTLKDGFKRKDLLIFTDSEQLKSFLENQDFRNTNLLLMSSGNYDDMDLSTLQSILNKNHSQ
ncbi:UDP-N-acetylmuramate--L-alanine ligase [Cecembia calidifontis]|uniref:UDP-N-acetylmuramate: L-alanyl-gamma-D-glutamyl-meso-diaminopimelate ligase n=1 Tax=Cecembia calidifontis TaxID=1187080 RepID=A0A4Q7PDK1_9BACT|nr:Mur ligase family protein [Cecembia calidifontis]RZS97700.1 UDP-N-acetylmuramate: L-alanyl-gamma-D-glutamyl-meso-diaminopimelate ligase [Cecembia calidifontis]